MKYISISSIDHLLQGTNIAAGKCRGVVIGTGLSTEIGKNPLNYIEIYFFLTLKLLAIKH